MTAVVTEQGILSDGANYPFTKPEGFDTWLKVRQDSFVAGVLYVYQGHATTQATINQPTQEQLL